MYLTNWLAKKDGCEGLAFPREFANGNVRIYGNVYGHPKFRNGELVRTGTIASYSDGKVVTLAGEEYELKCEMPIYLEFVQAHKYGRIILKKWKVESGEIVGETLDKVAVRGRVSRQCVSPNICELEDGRALFVDWLSRDPQFIPDGGFVNFLPFGLERCMPSIFGFHAKLFGNEK